MAKQNMRCWLYDRLSRDDDKEQNSLTNQRKIITEYAKSHGYTIVGESSDDNMTGMNFEREGIEKICEAAEAKKIDAVIVKDLSRLGRHKTQTALFIDYLQGLNVRVISVSENIDTFNEDDDLIIGFKQILNDFYAKDISRKIRFGYRQKQKDGLVIVPPFGYFKDKNTKQVVIIEECADIVRRIFHLYLDGYGFTTIARRLNDQGLKSPSYYQHQLLGKTFGPKKTKIGRNFMWNERTVDRILADRSYYGTLTCHKTETSKIKKTHTVVDSEDRYCHENFFPPIVTREIWEQAMTERASRVQRKVQASSNAPIHRYAGLLQCSECDASFTTKRRKFRENPERIEYVCSTYHRLGGSYCTSHRIDETALDEMLSREVLSLKDKAKSNWSRIEGFITQYTELNQANEVRIASIKKEIDELEQENSGYFRIMAKYPDREEASMKAMKENEDTIKCLQKQISEFKNLDILSQRKREKLKTSIDLLDDIVLSGAISKATINLLVDKILIHRVDDETIDVRFIMKGAFQNHVDLYETLWSMPNMNGDMVEKTLVEVLDQVEQMTA
jgi:DNA invertase Pin-like site-specific DNA recombinase